MHFPIDKAICRRHLVPCHANSHKIMYLISWRHVLPLILIDRRGGYLACDFPVIKAAAAHSTHVMMGNGTGSSLRAGSGGGGFLSS